MKRVLLLFVALISLTPLVQADDLYFIEVGSAEDAAALNATGATPLARLSSGYLVLTDDKSSVLLDRSGLKSDHVASGVTVDQLALDNRLDRANVDRYPLLFEAGNFRLYRVDLDNPSIQAEQPQLSRIHPGSIKIEYRPEAMPYLDKLAMDSRDISLDSLISLISQDSLYSYLHRLQAFYRRYAGTDSNKVSRDWIAGKLTDFGYDSIVIDTFMTSISGAQTECYNVVAIKTGSRFPDHEVIIGAHRDAVISSPGADDNGSGTVGVMEMARVLYDLETDMTIKFILFDAEEEGLLGSYHYAEEAAAREDNIVYMFNMDMIANIDNDSDVTVYHGDETGLSVLFNQLSDSLVGITGHLAGNIAASDHYPFSQEGWTVTFPIEYIFSDYYHTSHDSTVYCNFDYLKRIVQAGLATCYTVSQTLGPLPAVQFEYPEGLPEIVPPEQSYSFAVNVGSLYDGIPVSGSGQIYYSVDGSSYTSAYMTETAPNEYLAELPAASCYSSIRYYFSAEELNEGIYYDGSSSDPYVTFVATAQVTAFSDGFETDLGWTTTGLWERGAPTGGGGQYGNPDPSSAYEGLSVMGYNLDGDYENSLSERHLTSPTIDCSGLVGTKLRFYRWLGVEQSSYDHAYLRISTNGTSWTQLWTNEETISDDEWVLQEFDISAYADEQANVYIRFTMGTTDASWQYCGWNIDNLEVFAYECEDVIPHITTETLPDWTVGQAYSFLLESSGGTGAVSFSDKYGDLSGSGLTLDPSGLLTGTPSTAGAVSFTAMVTDEASQTDEKLLGCTINSAVLITSTSLPEWTEGVAYSQTLTAAGGTGSLTWTDRNNNLPVYGLTLSAGGSITGSPSSSGTVNFVATVSDSTGSADDQQLSITINSVPGVTTTTLPGGREGEAYGETLLADGGTGELVFSDKNGDLSGTGLSLDASGLLSGTPIVAGDITFTALVTDAVGATGESGLTVSIAAAYLCGDANNDGTGPDISDLVFYVSWMFAGGPAPENLNSFDVNNDGTAGDIADLVYLVTFMFQGGPDLQCP
ncbi:MAG TPA: M28 family peptidase [candidate division Zixibacteria bacterium]|nr:M28 family peptidase [candidate division Zixibacteria bacterium]